MKTLHRIVDVCVVVPLDVVVLEAMLVLVVFGQSFQTSVSIVKMKVFALLSVVVCPVVYDAVVVLNRVVVIVIYGCSMVTVLVLVICMVFVVVSGNVHVPVVFGRVYVSIQYDVADDVEVEVLI